MAYSIRYIPITKYEKRQYEYQHIDYQQLIEGIINDKSTKTIQSTILPNDVNDD